MIAGSALIVGP